ncbi:MAG: hypothetical protein HYU66_25565, partial [Armatimonadetes bacterium]|nr:hypothetical protein [Armatimonadota bacterium]
LSLREGAAQARALTGEMDALAGGVLKLEAGMLAVGGAVAVAFGRGAVADWAQREADIKGLGTVAHDAAAEMAQITQQATQPGANIEGGLAMVRGLEAAREPAQTAHQAIDATAKALSRMGQSSGQLKEVAFILQEGASAAKVSGETFRQLALRFPETREVMKAAFGSMDPEYIGQLTISGREAIARYVAEWDKLEGVGASTKNRIDNIGIAWHEARVEFGRGLISPGSERGMEDLAATIERLKPELFEAGREAAHLVEQGLKVSSWLLDRGPWQTATRVTVGLTTAVVGLAAAYTLAASARAKLMALEGMGLLTGPVGGVLGRFGRGGLRGIFGGAAGGAIAGAGAITAEADAARLLGAALGSTRGAGRLAYGAAQGPFLSEAERAGGELAAARAARMARDRAIFGAEAMGSQGAAAAGAGGGGLLAALTSLPAIAVAAAAATIGLEYHFMGVGKALRGLAASGKSANAQLDDLAKRGSITEEAAKAAHAPEAPGFWSTLFHGKRARDFEAWVGQAAPKPGKTEIGRARDESAEQAQIQNYKVLLDLAGARQGREEANYDLLKATSSTIGEIAEQRGRLDAAQEAVWQTKLQQAAAEQRLHPEQQPLVKVQLEIDGERFKRDVARLGDELLQMREWSSGQIGAAVANPAIRRWLQLSAQAWQGQRDAGLLAGGARVIGGRESLERSGGNRWETLHGLRAEQDAATIAAGDKRIAAAAAEAELQHDSSLLAREILGVEAERYELAARRAGEEKAHLQAVLGWETGRVAAQGALVKTQLDIAMARRRPAEEIAGLERAERAAAEADMAQRMQAAEMQVRYGENLLAVETEQTRQTQERLQLGQAEWQRANEVRERDLGWAQQLAGAQQGFAEAQLANAQAFGRPAAELLGLQNQIDQKRHAAQQAALAGAEEEVRTRKNIYALAEAQLTIAGQELQAAGQRHQLELGARQTELAVAGASAGLAEQRYQQMMQLYGDPRTRAMAGLSLGDMMSAQQAWRAEREQQLAQELALAHAQGPEAERVARIRVRAEREAADFRMAMDDKQLRRSRWLMGFTNAAGTPMSTGSNEAGFASALIGGDQGRIQDILQAAHRESLRPLQMLNDGLGALRRPDTTGLRDNILGALAERDKALIRAFVDAMRGRK